MSFELRKETIGNRLVFVIEGEFVLGPKLRHSSMHLKNLEGVTGIVVDLSGCKRIDSAGMGELLMWYGMATKAHQRMLLAGASESVKAMLRVARVDGILLCAVDRDAALAELS